MRIANALKEKLMDVRLRDKLIAEGKVTKEEVIASMKKMAEIVDQQNAGDPNYLPMSPSFNGHAFNAALKLAIEGKDQPSGYTEPILHQERLKFKTK